MARRFGLKTMFRGGLGTAFETQMAFGWPWNGEASASRRKIQAAEPYFRAAEPYFRAAEPYFRAAEPYFSAAEPF